MKHLKKFNESKLTTSLKNIYSELNPVLKIKKMNKYHKELKEEVEKMEKELEEKKKMSMQISNRTTKSINDFENPFQNYKQSGGSHKTKRRLFKRKGKSKRVRFNS